jgi:hypothetical protein
MDSKRSIRSKIKKRLDMIGPKTTTGYHLSELDKLSAVANEYEIEMPQWSVIYHKMLQAAVRNGSMR